MSTDNFENELLLLVGFLLTSAHGLVDEPRSYGPTRLLDAAGRLLAMMDERGMLDGSLREIRAEIDCELSASMDQERLLAKLDELALRWTELIADRF
ncbi:MAG: DUF6092 family protein [Anaerolineae bacterium]